MGRPEAPQMGDARPRRGGGGLRSVAAPGRAYGRFAVAAALIAVLGSLLAAPQGEAPSPALPRIGTDLADYAPGATAAILITGIEQGAQVAFQVQHVADPGPDGLWGTPDDVTAELGGQGHAPWTAIDGGEGDGDGLADGRIATSWYVNPDDSYGERFLLTGTAAPDGPLLASATFTDAGGDYTIDFTSARATKYNKQRPGEFTSYPVGRNNDPIVGADTTDDVESLAPATLALGQVVPFEFEVTVASVSATFTGTMQFTASWSTTTANGDAFGYDPAYGMIAAFVDGIDGNTTDPDSTVSGFTWFYDAVAEEIIATVTVTGLSANTRTSVEVWMVLQDTILPGTGGNVASGMVSAVELGTNSKINTGAQTVPLLKVQDFFAADADPSVVKSDEPGDTTPVAGDDPEGPLSAGDTFVYTIYVRNESTNVVANGVVVTDTLDPNVDFVGATLSGSTDQIGTYSAGTHSWTYNLGFLERADSAAGDWFNNEFTILMTVAVKAGVAPSTVLNNTVSLTTISDDPDLANNFNSEPTVLSPGSLSVAKSVEVYDPDGEGLFAVPGRDVIYTITVTNTGAAIDNSALVIVDPIPSALTFYRGAFDGTTSEPVKFADGTPVSGVTCCTSAHISYSTDGGGSFAYLPPDTYDPAITHLKVVPAGSMTGGGASFQIRFRARID